MFEWKECPNWGFEGGSKTVHILRVTHLLCPNTLNQGHS